jgi:hypothetical protein
MHIALQTRFYSHKVYVGLISGAHCCQSTTILHVALHSRLCSYKLWCRPDIQKLLSLIHSSICIPFFTYCQTLAFHCFINPDHLKYISNFPPHTLYILSYLTFLQLFNYLSRSSLSSTGVNIEHCKSIFCLYRDLFACLPKFAS